MNMDGIKVETKDPTQKKFNFKHQRLYLPEEMFSGVVFDVDDLLLGTQHLALVPNPQATIYSKALSDYFQFELPNEISHRVNHCVLSSNSKDILPELCKILVRSKLLDEVIEPENLGKILEPYRHRIILNHAINGEFPMLPGAMELFMDLKSYGKKIAVYSSNRRVICTDILDIVFKGSIKEFIPAELFLFGDDLSQLGGKRKPDPFGYLELSRRMQIDPRKLLAFDDSVEGICGALEAGYFAAIAVDGGKQTDFSIIESKRGFHCINRLSNFYFFDK